MYICSWFQQHKSKRTSLNATSALVLQISGVCPYNKTQNPIIAIDLMAASFYKIKIVNMILMNSITCVFKITVTI